MPSILDLETLLLIPYVEPDLGFDLSPDGARLAFSWNRTGQWEIYVLTLDVISTPVQITSGPGAKFAPRWSPDGQALAYALDLDGGELYDLYLWDPATGRQCNLTPNTADAILPSFSWSPDGLQIAFISDRAGRFDTYVLRLADGAIQPALALAYPDWEVTWSPDGRTLAVVTEAQGQEYWTSVVPLDDARRPTGVFRAVGDANGPICAKDASWSPDGRQLAFASDHHGRFEVGIYEPESGRITWIVQGEGDAEHPAWSPDGKRLACVVSHGPVTEVVVAALEGGPTGVHRVAPGVHYRPVFTRDGAHIVLVFDGPAEPDDLWLLSLNEGTFRQLTFSLPANLKDAEFSQPDQIEYPGHDGQNVPALLYRPGWTGQAAPAVLYVHGGPNWLTQVTWDPLVQHMVSRGWTVLAPNYRGSTGFGREWQYASRFDFGGVDTQDVVAGAEYLARMGIADPARIAVTGRSWGGYLTMTCLTQYPGLWAAGSAVVPFLNWFTGHRGSREDLQHWDLENFGDPQTDYALWRERSPFFYLEQITAPVQLISGAHDVRCPASESTQARDRLQALGKECDLVLYPDEGHSFLKIENRLDAEKRRIDFLAKYLERG
jgi:dipeptidyl aminopeptidase/acylaminoacyl peptidase